MQKRLASVHSIIVRGICTAYSTGFVGCALIPLPTIDVGEASQIKQQAFRVTMTLIA